MPKRKKKRRVAVAAAEAYEPEVTTPSYCPNLPDHLAGDYLMRHLGYSIHSRAPGRPAMWAKDGSTYSAEEVFRLYVSEEEIWEWNYARAMERHLETHTDL